MNKIWCSPFTNEPRKIVVYFDDEREMKGGHIMALQWSFNDKMGEITLDYTDRDDNTQELTYNLYQGNAWLIVVHECTDEQSKPLYSVTNFFADKQHMLNVLGLNPRKGFKDNCFFTQHGWKLKRLHLCKNKCDHLGDLVSAFARAFDNLTVEITAD